MSRKAIIGVAALGALIACSCEVSAAPVYIKLQETGYAPYVVGPGNGSESISNINYGTFYISSVTATGTPPLNEPDLNSSSIDFTSQHYAGGVLTVEISELNQFPLQSQNFQSFESVFGTSTPQSNFFGDFTSITEQTYATTCAGPLNPGCPASDAFTMGNLLSSTTFTSAGSSTTKYAAIPVNLAAPYVTTLVYTIDMPGGAYKEASASIDLSSSSTIVGRGGQNPAPLPAALPLFATGLGAMGLLGWRRKRKNAAAIVAA